MILFQEIVKAKISDNSVDQMANKLSSSCEEDIRFWRGVNAI